MTGGEHARFRVPVLAHLTERAHAVRPYRRRLQTCATGGEADSRRRRVNFASLRVTERRGIRWGISVTHEEHLVGRLAAPREHAEVLPYERWAR